MGIPYWTISRTGLVSTAVCVTGEMLEELEKLESFTH